MATQVILLERVEKLGGMGDVVSVKPGYARNFLLPQKKALRASKENIAYFEAKKKFFEAENDKQKKEAEKMVKGLDGLKISLVRQASESGKLFGSVNARDIADQIIEQSKQDISRQMIHLNQNFKTIGLFPVDVALHPEVKVEVIVNIARSVEEAEIQAKTGKALVADGSRDEAPAQPVVEDALEDVLEDGALEAEKEKLEQAEVDAQAEAALEAERAEKAAEKKAAKEAAEAEAAEAAEADAETSEDAASEE